MARPWSPVGIVWHSNGPSASTPSDPEEVDVPTYEYRCRSCGHELEVVQSFSDDALTECPNCQGQLRKVFGSIGVTFKGTGFYKNDHGSRKSPAETNGGTDSKSDVKSDAKSETKAESKSETKSETKTESKSATKSESKPASSAATSTA